MIVRDVLYFLRTDIRYVICILLKHGNDTEFHYITSYSGVDLLPEYLLDYIVYDIKLDRNQPFVELHVKGEI